MPKTAGIILVGNEILSGKIEDANASYLCRELRALGVDVCRITVIPDEVHLIAEEVAAFSRSFDVVFTSGGVGPTHDDVTIEGVARAMGAPVVRHPYLVELLERYYRGKVTAAALRMAEIPEGAELVRRRDGALPHRPHAQRATSCPACRRSSAPSSRRCASGSGTSRSTCATCTSASARGPWPTFSTGCCGDFPLLQLGSYPEFSNPEYKVKVTLESRDRGYVEQALADFLRAAAGRRGGAGDLEKVPRLPFGLALLAVGLMYLLGLGAAPFLDPPEGFHAAVAESLPGLARLAHAARGRRPLLRQAPAALLAHGAVLLDGGPDRGGRAHLARAVGDRRGGGHRAHRRHARRPARSGCWPGSSWRRTSACSCSDGMVKPDLSFILWIVLAFAGFVVAYRGGGRWGLAVFYASLGLAALTKDAVGASAPLLVVALFLWLTARAALRRVGAVVGCCSCSWRSRCPGTWRSRSATAASSGTRWWTTTC